MSRFCPSHEWDSYCKQQIEFLGCPVCNSPSENTWIEVDENDPKFEDLSERLKCKECGVYFDFANEHFDKFINIWSNEELD